MKTILLISGLLGFVANIPYIASILKTRNDAKPMKPSRVSWFIWALLDVMIVATSLNNGKTLIEIALPLGYAFGASVVAVLSIPYGEWGNLKEARLVFIGSAIGIAVWQLAGSEWALYAFVCVLWMSAWPTIKKIWVNPSSEPKVSWTMWFIAAVLSTVALGNPFHWTILGSVVTLTYLLMNIPIAYSLHLRKQ